MPQLKYVLTASAYAVTPVPPASCRMRSPASVTKSENMFNATSCRGVNRSPKVVRP